MSAYTYRMLFLQGYNRDDVIHNPNLNLLARWTPFACGCLGALGLGLRSPAYLWALGILTLIGAASSRSHHPVGVRRGLHPMVFRIGFIPPHYRQESRLLLSKEPASRSMNTLNPVFRSQPAFEGQTSGLPITREPSANNVAPGGGYPADAISI
jgi:hypothetical protein